MSTDSHFLRRIYMLVRTESNDHDKPDIRATYKIADDRTPPTEVGYKWCAGSTHEGTGSLSGQNRNVWIGLPSNSVAECTILGIGYFASDRMNKRMKEDIAAKMTEKLVDRYWRAQLCWDGRVDLARDDAPASLVLENYQEGRVVRGYVW